jgi:WD40 repeat protein
VTNVAYASQVDLFASVDFHGRMIVWDGAKFEKVREFKVPEGTLRDVAFSPDDRCLAFGGQLSQLWSWDRIRPSDAPVRHSCGVDAGQIESLVFSPDSKRLFAVLNEGHFCCLTLATQQITSFRTAARSRVVTVCPNKNLLAVGLDTGVIQYYELDTLKEVWSHQAHSSPDAQKARVISLAFTPDGRTLASAGMDGTVRLWHVETKQELMHFEGMPCQVNHLAFAPDGLTLAAALHNGEIWLWQAN